MLKDIKIRVNNKEESCQIQKRMFSLGYEWAIIGKKVMYEKKSFLYFHKRKFITFDNNEDYFKKHEFKELTIKEIMK